MATQNAHEVSYLFFAMPAAWSVVCVYVIGRYIKRKLNPDTAPVAAPVVQAEPASPDMMENFFGRIGMVILFPFYCVWVVAKVLVLFTMNMIGDHEFLSSLGGVVLAAMILQFVFGWHLF